MKTATTFLLCALSLAACNRATDKGKGKGPTTDTHMGDPGTGLLGQSCQSDADCVAGLVCLNNTCSNPVSNDDGGVTGGGTVGSGTGGNGTGTGGGSGDGGSTAGGTGDGGSGFGSGTGGGTGTDGSGGSGGSGDGGNSGDGGGAVVCGALNQACCQGTCNQGLVCYQGVCKDNGSTCGGDQFPYTDCTLTLGYYMNHSCWPTGYLYLGSVLYSQVQLQTILSASTMSNGLTLLARQLIAAKLNVLDGANASGVSAVIASADAMIGSLVVLVDYLNPAVTSSLSGQLDAFNQGQLSADHCQ